MDSPAPAGTAAAAPDGTAPPNRGDAARTLRAARVGIALTVLLLVGTTVIPLVFSIGTGSRNAAPGEPPIPMLRGYLDPKLGPGTVPALLIGLLGLVHLPRLAETLGWRRLLALSWLVGVGWMVALATVDGAEGISRSQDFPEEYLDTARQVSAAGDLPAMLDGFAARVPDGLPDSWATHVSGHPPGALLVFVALVRLGVDTPFSAGLAVIGLGALAVPGVLVCLRALGAESVGRRVLPYLVLTPAAIFLAVSADAVFTAVAAWGTACLALAATAVGRGRVLAWSVPAGLLLGAAVMLSYGLPLLGVLALAVLAAARSWRPLLPAALAAVAVVAVFGALGFWWWEGYAPLHERYWTGLAQFRPQEYWFFGDLAALLISAGPVLGVGVAVAVVRARDRWRARATSGADEKTTADDPERTVLLLGLAGVVMVLLADLSRMSKAEVERIWLPFMPWLLLTVVLLPERWRRPALAVQVAAALLAQHLFWTEW